MNIKDILSIAGKPGLYRLVAQSRNSIIVESLDTAKRIPISATQKISSLEEISIYTFSADVPLREVFEKIYAKVEGNEALSHKASASELHAFMASVLPDYDVERVYDSDLRKLFQWYNALLKFGRFNADNTAGDTPSAEVEAEIVQSEQPEAEIPASGEADSGEPTE